MGDRSSTSIDVAILDGHRVTTEGPSSLLSGEAGLRVGSAEEVPKPHVLLYPSATLYGAGIGLMPSLRTRFPDAAIVVLSGSREPGDVSLWFSAGARACLLHDASSVELVQAIHAVAQGGDYVQPSVGVSLARTSTHENQSLTSRETEVLKLIALGHTNAEIAEILAVSVRTVESHRSSLTSKLGASTRADLLRRAGYRGLTT